MTIAQKYLYIDIDRPINLLKKKLDRSIQILQNDLYDFSFSFFFLFKFTRIIYMIIFFNLTVNFINFVLVEELLSIVILL
jgi:hypothetical protein